MHNLIDALASVYTEPAVRAPATAIRLSATLSSTSSRGSVRSSGGGGGAAPWGAVPIYSCLEAASGAAFWAISSRM